MADGSGPGNVRDSHKGATSLRGDSSGDWSEDLDSADVEPDGNEPEGEPGDEPFPEVNSLEESPRKWVSDGCRTCHRDWVECVC